MSTQVESDPLSPAGRVNGFVMNLEAPYPEGLISWETAQPVSPLDLGAQCGTGNDDAVALKYEDPIYGKTEIATRCRPVRVLKYLGNLVS